MPKQSSITGFTVLKQDTPKRKREKKKEIDQTEVTSPSQSSPENKKFTVTTKGTKISKMKPPRTIENKEEVRAKHRGRTNAEEDNTPPASIPLPSSPKQDKTAMQTDEERTPGGIKQTDHQETEQLKKQGHAADDGRKNCWFNKRSEEDKEHRNQEVLVNTIPQGAEDESQKEKDHAPMKQAQDLQASGNIEEKHSDPQGHQMIAKNKALTPSTAGKTTKSTSNEGKLNDSTHINPMKQLTFKAALTKNNSPLLPQFKTHRVHVSITIKTPKNKAKRTEYLAKGLNKFLLAAKKVAPSNRTIYVRRFKEHIPIADTDKPQWIDAFGNTDITHLMHYTNGFYANQALRNGTFCFSVQLVVPITTDIESFLENVNGIWGDSTQIVRNCMEQKLYNPKQIGWFLRSIWNMSSTSELQDTLDKLATKAGYPNLHFGIQWKTIPSPGNKKEEYNKDTAIRAVVVSTNAGDVDQAWDILFAAYNSGKAPPGNADMHFVPTKDHPDIRNNQTAIHNITHLMESQRIFKENTRTEECYSLSNPDREYKDGLTIREKLLQVKSRVMGEKKKGARLFHSITARQRDGVKSYFITYHMALAKEATSIMSGLPSFISTELGVDPSQFCYPTYIKEDHTWIKETRTVKNSTVDFLSSLTGLQQGMMEEEEEEEEESYTMDSQCEREFRRTVGLDDAETVVDLKAQKRTRSKKIPAQVGSDKSVQSEMSGLTNFSTASKASQHRKELRKTIDDQREYMEGQAEAMANMQEQMVRMMQAVQSGSTLPDCINIPSFPTLPATYTGNQEEEFQMEGSPSLPQDTTNTESMLIQMPDNHNAEVDRNTQTPPVKQCGVDTDQTDAPDTDMQDATGSVNTIDQPSSDVRKSDLPTGNTFTDSKGQVWETGSILSLDNPDGENREVDESWFQVTSGDEKAARAYAMKLYREGHEVVISRTGAIDSETTVVYTIVHDSEVGQEQDSGQGSDPEMSRNRVGFTTTSEVQEYDPSTAEIKGNSDIIHTKKDSVGQDSPQQSKQAKEDHPTPGERVKGKEDTSSSEDDRSDGSDDTKEDSAEDDSSESTSTSKSSSQSPGDSDTSEHKAQAKKSTNKQPSPSTTVPIQDTKIGKNRAKNLTKDIIAETAKMKKAQVEKRASPRGKQKSKSGRESGRGK